MSGTRRDHGLGIVILKQVTAPRRTLAEGRRRCHSDRRNPNLPDLWCEPQAKGHVAANLYGHRQRLLPGHL